MRVKSIIFFALIGIYFNGCSSKVDVNPDPSTIQHKSIKEEVKERLHENKGYQIGKADGFKEGVMWSANVVKKYIKEIKDLQFTNYLMKEKYVQAGAIYIDKYNKIAFGEMEIRPPYSVADLFKRFGGDIPRYVNHIEEKTIDDKFFNGGEETTKGDKKSIVNGESGLKETFNPSIYEKSHETKELNKQTNRETWVSIKNTKTNKKLITELGIQSGVFEDKYILNFSTKKSAEDFCRNFQKCMNIIESK